MTVVNLTLFSCFFKFSYYESKKDRTFQYYSLVLFIFLQNKIFLFLSLLNRVPCVPYVPAWSTCKRAKSVPTSHFYAPKNVPTCQKACHFFQFRLPKSVQKELYFFICLIYLTYFVYFNYMPNTYIFHMNIYFFT